jgi:uncharacterized membrane protein
MARKKSSSQSTAGREVRLAGVIEQNIHTIAEIRKNTANKRTTEERIADAITDFSGRMYFVYFHLAWFIIWIVINLGLFGLEPFDPFPFGLLTMIVSLEAIFLSTFVLISQNRLSAESDRRADLDLQMVLLSEHELTRALQMLDAIQDKLGIENDSDAELNDLEENVHPKDVIKEIERVQQGINKNIKKQSKNKKS